jgi:hypothetical protein
MRTPFYLPLSREITLVLCDLSPNGGNEFLGLFQGLQRGQKAPTRTVQACIIVEVSAFLSPLVRSMEPQEIESELSDA